MTWQTMDTAPKDGTEILLWDIKNFAIVGYWHRVADHWTSGDYALVPTHWMPLPEGPKA